MLIRLSKRRKALITLATLIGTFLAALDSTVVGTAMPTVIGELGGLEHQLSGQRAERRSLATSRCGHLLGSLLPYHRWLAQGRRDGRFPQRLPGRALQGRRRPGGGGDAGLAHLLSDPNALLQPAVRSRIPEAAYSEVAGALAASLGPAFWVLLFFGLSALAVATLFPRGTAKDLVSREEDHV